MTHLTVWSREGCGLCAELLDELLPWAAGRDLRVDVRDLDAADEATQRRFVLEIPVVLHADAVVCRGRLDLAAVERNLAGATGATGATDATGATGATGVPGLPVASRRGG